MNRDPERKIISVPEGKIRDYIDGRPRKDTPEEYVRQTIEKRLVNEHKYQPDQIKVEFGIKMGTRRPRADIVIFPKDSPEFAQDYVEIIIECKSEKIGPKNKQNGIKRLQSYMSACLNCEWGMWTNGKHKEVWRKVEIDGRSKFQEYNDIPSADGSLDDVDRPKRNTLKKAYEDNLLMVFRTCHNHIYAADGLKKEDAFFELLKLIFCKTLDEQNVGRSLEFYATSGERSNRDGQLTVKNRISKIFKTVKDRFPQIFATSDEIELRPRSLAWIVSELQPYSLLETHVDVKGKAYEELVGANLRGDRGQFFTPRNVMHMAVEMINPKPDEKVCDTSCGTGGFLVMAMNHVTEQLKIEVEKDLDKSVSKWTDHEKHTFRERIKEIASSNFYGFDIDRGLVKATKMNMVMNNDGSGNIYQNNSLDPPHEWETDLKKQLTETLNIETDSIRNADTIEFFDVIVTNPPFGTDIPVKDSHVLEQFDLGYIWHDEQHKTSERIEWTKSAALQSSVPPEQLFIERCLQFLKPKGRLAIVVPDSILGNPSLGYIRQWLLERTRIIASVDLHADTFKPGNGTQTSVLILQKKTREEINEERYSGIINSYSIFMAMVEKIGHDRRGNTLFKRDEDGNEIWVPENRTALTIETTAEDTVTYETETRIIDDQSREVPAVFDRWKQEEGIPW